MRFVALAAMIMGYAVNDAGAVVYLEDGVLGGRVTVLTYAGGAEQTATLASLTRGSFDGGASAATATAGPGSLAAGAQMFGTATAVYQDVLRIEPADDGAETTLSLAFNLDGYFMADEYGTTYGEMHLGAYAKGGAGYNLFGSFDLGSTDVHPSAIGITRNAITRPGPFSGLSILSSAAGTVDIDVRFDFTVPAGATEVPVYFFLYAFAEEGAARFDQTLLLEGFAVSRNGVAVADAAVTGERFGDLSVLIAGNAQIAAVPLPLSGWLLAAGLTALAAIPAGVGGWLAQPRGARRKGVVAST